MSRIDEAMRVSGQQGAVDLAHRGHRINPFVSAWKDQGEAATPPSAETPKPQLRPSSEMAAPPAVVERSRLLQDPSEAIGVSRFNPEFVERLVLPQNDNLALVEQFRRLAGQLHNTQAASGIKVLLIASAAPGDGKTLTAMNLALTLSESYGRNVLLVDVDLRRPATQHLAQFGEVGGLTQGLRSASAQRLEVVRLTKSLTLLPAGRPMADPTRLITSPRMRQIIDEAAQQFDWVILDAPPVGPVTDASLLMEMADGALLVVRAGQTRHGAVQRAVKTLGTERIIGVVLNAANESSAPYSDYSYSQTDPGQ